MGPQPGAQFDPKPPAGAKHTNHPHGPSKDLPLEGTHGSVVDHRPLGALSAAQVCETRLFAPDGDGNEDLATSVVLSGSIAIAGAPGEQVNGLREAGAAYTWFKSPISNEWFHSTKLSPQGLAQDDRFGADLDMDIVTVVVGAPGKVGAVSSTTGKVYVYRTPNGGFSWQLDDILESSDGQIGDNFGASVAVSDDTIVVGAPGQDELDTNRGAAYVFTKTSSGWLETQKILPPANITGLGFGSVCGADGLLACIGGDQLTGGTTASGTVAAYRRNSSGIYDEVGLAEPQGLAVADFFGTSLDMQDGRLVVGARNDDTAGANAGAVYVFDYNSTQRRYDEQQKLVPAGAMAGDRVGTAVSLSGDRIALGASERANGGAAWIFGTNALGAWQERRYIRPSQLVGYGRAGASLALSGTQLLLGDPADDTVAFASGAAFALEVSGQDVDGNGVADGCENLYAAYCTNATANSSGSSGTLRAEGSPYVVDQNLIVVAEDLPQGVFGFLLASQTQGFVAQPGGSDGNLCLAGSVGRLLTGLTNSGPGGTARVSVDLDALPDPLATTVAAGDTWNFQYWHRDSHPLPTSNFTSAISVNFQ